jgi:hypothetical protein
MRPSAFEGRTGALPTEPGTRPPHTADAAAEREFELIRRGQAKLSDVLEHGHPPILGPAPPPAINPPGARRRSVRR